MLNAFTNLARITRSYIPAVNVPVKMDVPNVRRTSLLEAHDANFGDPRTLAASQSSAPTHKHGKPFSSMDSHLKKRKPTKQAPEELVVNLTVAYLFYPTHEEILDYGSIVEQTNPLPENHEISVYYPSLDDVWCRNEMIIDNTLAYAIATKIMSNNDIEPHSFNECRHRIDWSNWKQAIKVKLDSQT
ncbi:hypothetical protein COP2_028526 [Malus domestica]